METEQSIRHVFHGPFKNGCSFGLWQLNEGWDFGPLATIAEIQRGKRYSAKAKQERLHGFTPSATLAVVF